MASSSTRAALGSHSTEAPEELALKIPVSPSPLSTAMMLRYTFNKDEWAYRIEAAVKNVLAAGYRTPDIDEAGAKKVGTVEMGNAVVAAL